MALPVLPSPQSSLVWMVAMEEREEMVAAVVVVDAAAALQQGRRNEGSA